MTKMTGGQLLVETLRGHGVRQVFSIIGGQMCSVYDALSEAPEIELVTVRNEAAAPMMAAGACAVTGTPAVSMCTVGAGVVYEVAGLLAAWYGYLPVISIAPQVQSWKMKPHQENLQGLNQDGIFEPITKWNATIYHWERIPSLVDRALREALANAPGPVHLDIPVDVLFKTGKIDAANRGRIMPPAANTRYGGALPGPEDQVAPAAAALTASSRPLALIGQGMGRPGRHPRLTDYLNRMAIPALASDASSGIMDGNDPSHVGAIGLFLDSESGLNALREADRLLVIGLDDQVLELIGALGPQCPPIIQVEVDPSALLTGRRGHLGVNADPVSLLAVCGAGPGAERKAWLDRVQQAGEDIAAQVRERLPGLAAILTSIRAGLTGDEVLVVDGADTVRAAHALLRRARYRSLLIMNTRDLAGAGLPFAIGAKIALPGSPVILVADQDSLMRHLQEFQTATARGLGLDIVWVDPGAGPAFTRTSAILAGLGCEVARLEPGQSLSPPASRRPRAWLCGQ
jgi:acetolactate synthase I/II/III large subunit